MYMFIHKDILGKLPSNLHKHPYIIFIVVHVASALFYTLPDFCLQFFLLPSWPTDFKPFYWQLLMLSYLEYNGGKKGYLSVFSPVSCVFAYAAGNTLFIYFMNMFPVALDPSVFLRARRSVWVIVWQNERWRHDGNSELIIRFNSGIIFLINLLLNTD